MHKSMVNSQGNFTGKYHIAVLSTQKSNESSPLVSSQHLDFRTIFQSLYKNEGGKEILLTPWYEQRRVYDNHWKIIK
ncbi:hypothetical protein Q9966_005926 [Columba livia]|nr:hypothetical protein Q9966_005926 [Columba livia]